MTRRTHRVAVLLAALPVVAACSTAPKPAPATASGSLIAYRKPEIPPECRDAVYSDPEVKRLIAAGTAVPIYAAVNQDKLAFAQDEALRKCLREKGLLRGGVEPVRHVWYPLPF